MNTFQTVSEIEAHFATKATVLSWSLVEVIAYGCKYLYRYERGIGYTIQPNMVALKPVVYPDDIEDTDDDIYPGFEDDDYVELTDDNFTI